MKRLSHSQSWFGSLGFVLGLSIVEGFLAILFSAIRPSEAGSAVLFGLSKSRLAILGAFSLALIFLVILVSQSRRLEDAMARLGTRREGFATVVLMLSWLTVLIGVAAFFFAYSPIRTENSFFHSVVGHVWMLLLWAMLTAVQLGIYVLLTIPLEESGRYRLRLLAVSLFFIVFTVAFNYYDSIDWARRISGATLTFLAPSLFALLLAFRPPADERGVERLRIFLKGGLLVTTVFALHRFTSFAVARTDTPSKAYWAELADAFLNGRLYLKNPATNHDLTFYNGQWYVPNPPMPALVLVPFVAWLGLDAVNMTVVSAVIGALNALVMWLFLRACSEHGLVRLSEAGVDWLTLTFVIGTNHLWLVTLAQMWFVSQLLTVLFVGLACLATVRSRSPWLIGLLLGCAVLTRPNIFPMAIFLAGIYLFLNEADGINLRTIDWRRFLTWGAQAAVPALSCVFLLLFYNRIRFDDWFDFGYVTINGAPYILEAVQRYGMFHPHFFAENFRVMLLRLPRVEPVIDNLATDSFAGFYLHPGVSGYSIFAMTPPLVYAFRRFRKNYWFAGAWLAILSSVVLLLMYHNTGAEQIGYRYLMDLIFPVFLVMGLGMGERPSWRFQALTWLGVLINFLSLYWWYFIRA